MVLFLQKIRIDNQDVWEISEEETHLHEVIGYIQSPEWENKKLSLVLGSQGTIRDTELFEYVNLNAYTAIYNRAGRDWLTVEIHYNTRREQVLFFSSFDSASALFSLVTRPAWKIIEVQEADTMHDADLLLSTIGGDSVEYLDVKTINRDNVLHICKELFERGVRIERLHISSADPEYINKLLKHTREYEHITVENFDVTSIKDSNEVLSFCDKLSKIKIKIERLHISSADSNYIRKLRPLIKDGMEVIATDTDPQDLRMSLWRELENPGVFLTSDVQPADRRRSIQAMKAPMAIRLQINDGNPLIHEPPTVEITDFHRRRDIRF